MKATLEFNLPEEQMEFNRVNQSLDMACALFDILQLRKKLQRHYDSFTDENVPDAYDALYRMADEIAEILNEHNINIDKLIE
jgi:hypothetical protein